MKLFANLPAIAALLLSCTGASPAFAQSTASSVVFPAGYAPGYSICVRQADGRCIPVSTDAALPADTVIRSTSVDRGALVGTSAITLIPADPNRRGFFVQNQSASATCYFNGLGAATADFHSYQMTAGGDYQTPATHVGTGAISFICSAANTPIYVRSW